MKGGEHHQRSAYPAFPPPRFSSSERDCLALFGAERAGVDRGEAEVQGCVYGRRQFPSDRRGPRPGLRGWSKDAGRVWVSTQTPQKEKSSNLVLVLLTPGLQNDRKRIS